jgi:pilus assembly protein CpaC
MLARRIVAGALCATIAAGITTPAFAQVSVVTDESSVRAGELQVPVNKSQVLRVDRSYGKALVGNPDIADVLPLTDRSIYVLGKKMGTTSLTLYDHRNQLIAVVDVSVGPDVIGLRRQLSELIPADRIGARISNDSIVLDGVVSSGPAADRAVQLAETYAPGKVVNLMSIGSSQQVMLEVRFSEVKRSALKQIGLGLGVKGSHGLNGVSGNGASLTPGADVSNTVTDPITGATSTFTTPGKGLLALGSIASSFGIISRAFNVFGGNISATLDALETQGTVTTLAEPTLVALSGETASFLAGGEFPIPVSQGGNSGSTGSSNNITVEFKPFGVSLAFTPTVLADGVISLVVAPEVSSIDQSASIVINGLRIPGLQTRRAKTVVELRDGESFAMAGLLRKDFQDTVRQVPLLGSIPIIGTLFRSTGFQKDQTELVIIVTPRLVRPVPAGVLKVPTDRATPPNEADLFLLGRTDGAVSANALDPNQRSPVGRPIGEPRSVDGPNAHPVLPPAPLGPGGMANANPKSLEKDYGHVL